MTFGEHGKIYFGKAPDIGSQGLFTHLEAITGLSGSYNIRLKRIAKTLLYSENMKKKYILK